MSLIEPQFNLQDFETCEDLSHTYAATPQQIQSSDDCNKEDLKTPHDDDHHLEAPSLPPSLEIVKEGLMDSLIPQLKQLHNLEQMKSTISAEECAHKFGIVIDKVTNSAKNLFLSLEEQILSNILDSMTEITRKHKTICDHDIAKKLFCPLITQEKKVEKLHLPSFEQHHIDRFNKIQIESIIRDLVLLNTNLDEDHDLLSLMQKSSQQTTLVRVPKCLNINQLKENDCLTLF